MPIHPKYHADFYSGGIFHVYNRTNNKEQLFRSDENRSFFLKQYSVYIQPFAETFCWCLLPNHFHFLIRVRAEEEIITYLKQQTAPLKRVEKKFLDGTGSFEELIEQKWRHFFTSYSMSYNKQYQRKGNLLHRPFKRLEIDKESHFTQAVVYIHSNPLHHGLCNDFTLYKWSSWESLLSNKQTMLKRQEIFEWFGSRELFIKTHHDLAEYYYKSEADIE